MNFKQNRDIEILGDLALIAERLSHSLRSPLSVVRGLFSDMQSGFTLSAADFSDANLATDQLVDALQLLRGLNIGTAFSPSAVPLHSVANCIQQQFELQASAREPFSKLRHAVTWLSETRNAENAPPSMEDIAIECDPTYLAQAIAGCLLFQWERRRRAPVASPPLAACSVPQPVSTEQQVVKFTLLTDNSKGSVSALASASGLNCLISIGSNCALAGASEVSLSELSARDQSIEALFLVFAGHVLQAHGGNAIAVVPDNGIPDFQFCIPV